MAKQNRFLAAVQKKMVFARKFAMQMSLDIACIALNREFGFGEKRICQFRDAFQTAYAEFAEMCVDDAESDRTIEFSKAKLDAALHDCCGDAFVPWEKRYKF